MTPERAYILAKLWKTGIIKDTNELIEIRDFLQEMVNWLDVTKDCNVLRFQLMSDLGVISNMLEARGNHEDYDENT